VRTIGLIVLGFLGGLAAAAIGDLTSFGAIFLGFLGSLAAVIIGDLVSEEVRARLDQLPHAVLRLAIRRLPAQLRADISKEWRAELDHVLRRAKLYPATRLIVGVRFAAGLLRTAPGIAQSLALARAQEPAGGLELHRGVGLPQSMSPGPARRTLDVLAAAVGLLLLSPVLALLALAVKLSGPGPVLFRQTRVGQGFSPFTIFKFRTMRTGSSGPEFTPAGDARITRVGQLLRHSGLDELPQLLNVLRGDMTLVGPRPEPPALAWRYPDECHEVFAYRPGLTGPAQVRLRDKEVLSAEGSDLEQYYLGELVRRRAALDLEYLSRPTLRRTIVIMAETVVYILRPLGERLMGLLRPDRCDRD
jgi:lipopolysaccharide/colanic/teichoic acid biosynthesis glycosyltransferase